MPTKIGNVLSWAPDIDGKTLDQAHRSSKVPVVEGHVALMPDAHFGYGATVGSVIPTRTAVIPSAVGVDIGCGMIAARLDLTAAELPDDLRPLHGQIARAVPAGVGKGHDAGLAGGLRLPATVSDWEPGWSSKAALQCGTLGSGNHFVELCLDELERAWIVVHSGSRGIGKLLAEKHIERARNLMRDYFIKLEDSDLAYLVAGTAPFDAYITDMLWAQDYAALNRTLMLKAIHAEVQAFLRRPVTIAHQINCHHNFTEREHHHGKDLWITRKGAIRARVGDFGVIPGSMGAASYIVSGKGNPASYCSCSHGAGRRLSRGAAKRELTEESLIEAMAGKAWNNDSKGLLDEHPLAYKDIDTVMRNQEDLVEVHHVLHQILNYKGQ